ncbi:MAG: UMP kinase [Candidatus Diapherotrites archaeon]|nr:UMP kinase [Candidatus Diapherotrites archaeon]
MNAAVVLKVGGSSLGEEGINPKSVATICSVINELKEKLMLGVVVGAGRFAGGYITAARKLGINEFQLDSLAIDVSRLNAKLIARGTGFNGLIPTSVESAARIMESKGFVVMGGTSPGHTTNAVAALLAENIEGRLVNVTRVGGVYDKDPDRFKDAKKLDKISYEELVEMAARYDKRKARTHFVFDLLAAKIIARSEIPACIIGSTPNEVKNACLGKSHPGTVVE